MDIILAVIAAVALLAVLVVALVRSVRSDGYGQGPAPRSHADWTELPYRSL